MLVGKLFEGAVDVVGDVHGEVEVLESLIHRLGYDERGWHPDGRRLVFVGDLIDRGPASVAVVDRVQELVQAERAQCVLGNHELNVLRRDPKKGNEWFFRSIDESDRTRICAFLLTLPLALEREDLRVVHACWDEARIALLRDGDEDVVEVSKRIAEEIDHTVGRVEVDSEIDLEDEARKPPMLDAVAKSNVRRQAAHPVKVLTSGLEEVASEPFWAGDRWRFEQRVRWWEGYEGPMVVVGHYWRSPRPNGRPGKGGPDLFEGIAPTAALGPAQRVMCIDYSIGKRSEEREAGATGYSTALAAYRWPEGEVRFSPCLDGSEHAPGDP